MGEGKQLLPTISQVNLQQTPNCSMFNLFENEGKALLFLGDDMTLIVKKLMIIRHVQIQYSLSIRSIHQSNFLNSASSSKSYLLNNTRKGWCPRTGGGQRLMIRIAVNEDIVLATCQDKYSE